MDTLKKALHYVEHASFGIFLLAWEAFILIILAVWAKYPEGADAASDLLLYDQTRDVAIMIFFGFGFLMTFLRRYGFSAIGYSFMIAAIVVQWSIILQLFFEELNEGANFNHRRDVGVNQLLNGLFCAGAVLISYGAVLGKINPIQICVMSFIEPFFYWVNTYVIILVLEAHDIGGGMTIHTFGAYYGIFLCLFVTSRRTKGHPDNVSCYSSDIFSLAGTLFLFIMWPSFNAVLAEGAAANRAIVNTLLSLCGATISSFIASRWLCHGKFEVVHIQNSTLAGGVVMGVAADLDINPASAIACGLVAGAISVFGYIYITPFMSKYLGMQDVCGIHNLHGIPGVMGAILAIFATTGLGQSATYQDEFPHGSEQAGYQVAALFITLGIAIGSGIGTGAILLAIDCFCKIPRDDLYNDRGFWQLPSDYEWVVEREDDEVEMDEMGNEVKKKRGKTFLRPHAGAKYDSHKDNKDDVEAPQEDKKKPMRFTRTGSLVDLEDAIAPTSRDNEHGARV